jgi:hypothetical protein
MRLLALSLGFQAFGLYAILLSQNMHMHVITGLVGRVPSWSRILKIRYHIRVYPKLFNNSGILIKSLIARFQCPSSIGLSFPLLYIHSATNPAPTPNPSRTSQPGTTIPGAAAALALAVVPALKAALSAIEEARTLIPVLLDIDPVIVGVGVMDMEDVAVGRVEGTLEDMSPRVTVRGAVRTVDWRARSGP